MKNSSAAIAYDQFLVVGNIDGERENQIKKRTESFGSSSISTTLTFSGRLEAERESRDYLTRVPVR